jgi:outer membrane receptor protein involved in Fe transport
MNAANPPLNLDRNERTIVNAGVAYRFRPALSFTVDVNNLFNEPQSFYRGFPDRMQRTIIPGTTITFGMSGRF